jgi:uncharacterized membrane protein YbhN (UPF0104 family)
MTDQGIDSVPSRRPWVRMLLAALKLLVSATILVALYVKFKSQIPALSSVDFRIIAIASALLRLQPILIGARWRRILRAYEFRRSLFLLIRITWVSVAANQFLPAGIGGDAIRIFFVTRTGVPLGTSVSSVVIDRIVALLALAILVVAFIGCLERVIDGRLGATLAAGFVVCLLAGYALARRLRRPLPVRLDNWPIIAKSMSGIRHALAVLDSPSNMLTVLANAIGVHLLSAVAFVLVTIGLGIHAPFLSVIAVSLLLTFVQMIPISIGGWGLREAASVGLLSAYGVDGGHAALASLLLGFAYLFASLPGAFLWLGKFNGERIEPQSGQATG